MKILFTLLACICMCPTFAQDTSKYQLSSLISFREIGWNRILLMRNGNTILFHFEPRKAIVVKVFNKDHQEIAGQKHICQLFDINALDRSEMKGFYDINGEAVMFVEQAVDNKRALLRLRFDAVNAKLIEEKKVVQVAKFPLRLRTYILKEKNKDDYSVLYYTYPTLREEGTLALLQFNGKHELKETMPVAINKDTFQYKDVIDANIDDKGNICFTLGLTNVVTSSFRRASYYNPEPNIYEKRLAIYYLPKGKNTFIVKRINIPQIMNPYATSIAYDTSANALNWLLFDSRTTYFKNGLNEGETEYLKSLLYRINDTGRSLSANWLTSQKIDDNLKAAIDGNSADTNSVFHGVPVSMFADNGITTVVMQNCDYTLERGYNGPYGHENHLGIMQYNSKGEETWGQALSLDEYAIGKGLARVNCYSTSKGLYILYNDKYNSSSVYYKMTGDHQLEKYYLLGPPDDDKTKVSFIACNDFNTETNTYATLVLNDCRDKYTLKVAWCQLN